jgi:hypothetical protein
MDADTAEMLENSAGKADGSASASVRVSSERPDAKFGLICDESFAFDRCNITVVAMPSPTLMKFTRELVSRDFVPLIIYRDAGETLWKTLATLTVANRDGGSYHDSRWSTEIRVGVRSLGSGYYELVSELTNSLTSYHRGLFTVTLQWGIGLQGLPDERDFSLWASWE